jgi:hypothetical protein
MRMLRSCHVTADLTYSEKSFHPKDKSNLIRSFNRKSDKGIKVIMEGRKGRRYGNINGIFANAFHNIATLQNSYTTELKLALIIISLMVH